MNTLQSSLHKKNKQLQPKQRGTLTPFALILSGCGSGNQTDKPLADENGADVSHTYSGAVVKGPLENAMVFIDENADGKLNDDEAFTKTDNNGYFILSSSIDDGEIIAITDSNTVDHSSGTVLPGVTLKAPAGATVVTPLTTLMVQADISEADVLQVFGLPSDINPTNFNPYSDEVDLETAIAVEKVSHQIVTTVTTAAEVVKQTTFLYEDAFDVSLAAMAERVTEVVQSNQSGTDSNTLVMDLNAVADVGLITDKVVGKISQTDTAAGEILQTVMPALNSAVANVNAELENVSDLTSTETKSTFAVTSELREQVSAAAKSPSQAVELITFTNIDSVEESIAVALAKSAQLAAESAQAIAEANLMQVNAELEQLKQEFEQANNQLTELESFNTTLSSQAGEYEEIIASLTAETATLRAEVASLIDHIADLENSFDETPFSQHDMNDQFAAGAASVDITTDNQQAINDYLKQHTDETPFSQADIDASVAAAVASVDITIDNAAAIAAAVAEFSEDTTPFSQADIDAAVATAFATGAASVDITLDNAAAITAAFASAVDNTPFSQADVDAAVVAAVDAAAEVAAQAEADAAAAAQAAAAQAEADAAAAAQAAAADAVAALAAAEAAAAEAAVAAAAVGHDNTEEQSSSSADDTPFSISDLNAASASAFAAGVASVDITTDNSAAVEAALAAASADTTPFSQADMNAAINAAVHAALVESSDDNTPFSQADMDAAFAAAAAAEIATAEANLAALQAAYDVLVATVDLA